MRRIQVKKILCILLSIIFVFATGKNAIVAFEPGNVNPIDSIVITKQYDHDQVLAEWAKLDPGIGTITVSDKKFISASAVILTINWSDTNVPEGLHEGDYFTFKIPDIFEHSRIEAVESKGITDDADEIIAYYSIDKSNGEIKCTFTKYVESQQSVQGKLWVQLYVGEVDEAETEKEIEFVINGQIAAQGNVIVDPIPPYESTPPEPMKYGTSLPSEEKDGYYLFHWHVFVNMQPDQEGKQFNTLENLSFEDVIPTNSPHVFISEERAQELSLEEKYTKINVSEYTGADDLEPESRYAKFLQQYYGHTPGESWRDNLTKHLLADGTESIGLDGRDGLNISNVEKTDKLLSAELGTLTRPTEIEYYTISTFRMAESALGDPEFVKTILNTFRGIIDLDAELNLYYFSSGGSAQGINGDSRFEFTKVNEKGEFLPGAAFNLYCNKNLSGGANRIAFSNEYGIVAFNNLAEGTYYFQESIAPEGYVLDDTIYKVVIRKEGFNIYYGEEFATSLALPAKITNKKMTSETSVVLTATKTLTGKALESGMFTFEVKDSENNTVATGTNQADGTIAFSEIRYTTTGSHGYTLSECVGSDPNITYDTTQHSMTVNITQNQDGTLIPTVNQPEGGICFYNIYTPDPVSVVLTATKTLTGKALESGMFTFEVKDSENNTVATGTNQADGTIAFSEIRYTTTGSHGYTLSECVGSDPNITYDTTQHSMTVNITQNQDGTLIPTVNQPEGGTCFYNIYTPDPVDEGSNKVVIVPKVPNSGR